MKIKENGKLVTKAWKKPPEYGYPIAVIYKTGPK